MTGLKIHVIDLETGQMIANDWFAQAPRIGDEIVNGKYAWRVAQVAWILDERSGSSVDRVNLGVIRVDAQ